MAKFSIPLLLLFVFFSCKKDKNNPPIVSDQIFEIEENSANGSSLGFIQAYDSENDLLQYEIMGVDNSFPFQVNLNTGELIVSNTEELDFEQQEEFIFIIKVYETDAPNYTNSSTIKVKLLDIPEIPLNGMVAYYPFDGNANDESGNNYNGTTFGPSLTTGHNGHQNSAYYFDGYNDYINIGSINEFRITGDLTISFWINPESFSGIRGVITCQADASDNNQTNALYKLVFIDSSHLYYYHESGNGTDIAVAMTGESLTPYSWTHITMTRDVYQKMIRLYINGTYRSAYSYERNPENGLLSTTKIGINHGAHSKNQIYYKGKLDEIAIYNRVLSNDEIEALHNH